MSEQTRAPLEIFVGVPESARVNRVATLVHGYFDGDMEKTLQWFRLPNPLLGNVSPMDMVRVGRVGRLERFVERRLLGDEV